MRNYSFNNNKIYGGPIEQIFGSDDGFALFLNGMGFSSCDLEVAKSMLFTRIFATKFCYFF